MAAATLKRKREVEQSVSKERDQTPEISDTGSQGEDDEKPEDEEWNGVNASEPLDVDEELPRGGKHAKVPTGVEVREMKEAAGLFRSSSFKLQIDAILPNVRPKDKHRLPLETFLLSLHTLLMNIPSTSPAQPLDATRPLLKKGVSVPYATPLPTEDSNWKVAFEAPSNIILAGSWNTKTSVKPPLGGQYGIDVAVVMPDSLFQEKDYLNGRFFHKRAFYLATLSAALSSKIDDLKVDLAYHSQMDNPRLTKLVLTPRPGSFKLNVEISIIPVLSTTSPLLLQRLAPSECSVRSAGDDARKPTPMYNTALLTALSPPSHLLSVHKWQQEAAAFTDALTLLRVWANQRGFCEGSRMQVRGFEGKGPWWSTLLGLLVTGEETVGKPKRKPLGRGLSSYQFFKAALDFLATFDFGKERIFLKTGTGHNYPPSEYAETHDAVFVDASSRINLLADVPLGSLDFLKCEAKKTLSVLESASSSFDPFAETFLHDKHALCTRFDAIVRVDLSTAALHDIDKHSIIDHASPHNALLASISRRLRQGLGDRTKAVTLLHPTSSRRPLSQALPSNSHIFYIGLVYDTETAFRQVDHGPDAKDPESAAKEAFQELWGDKAELRMFKDGKIQQSVVWDVKTADEKSHIPIQIVKYLLDIHFGITDGRSWHSSFDTLIRMPEPISKMYAETKQLVGFKGATTAFDNLVKAIKALPEDELPLSILNFVPCSSALRYTSAMAPVPRLAALPANASYVQTIPLIVQFEKSAKWPDDLKAIRVVKMAFFERIASSLMNAIPGLTAAIAIRGEDDNDPTMEVLTPEGWAFAIHIWHDRELTLLNRIIVGDEAQHIKRPGEKKPTKGAEYHDAVAEKEVYLRRFIHGPRHHRAVTKLHHAFPAFSGTTRLVKRWFAAHWLLDGHVSEEAIELLCAHVFAYPQWESDHDANPEAFAASASQVGSKERGFAMVIEFLQSWKWDEGLLVALYDAGSAADGESTEGVGSGQGVWALKTEMDPTGRVWTNKGPDSIVARRIQALARATWGHLGTVETESESILPIFTHPNGDYHFLVELNPSVLPRYHQNVHADLALLSQRHKKFSNLQNTPADEVEVRIGFDPARLFFKDLQRIYANTFRIFWDPLGGDTFGAVWDPTLREPRSFKVLGGFSSAPCPVEAQKGKGKDSKSKDLVVLNEAAVLSEIRRLGQGLVKDVVPQKK
ncbi:Nrap protein [Cylindrobasidium torrendii FP15055 ss-10]|uniref:U3 small nucleolar RNA-associated protein 22 n=1 Tax=Cylindrobasidium torrendii FP15055 ss-10 TaxID=1314674 RepID=A0A0D7B5J3_9AGAR|nr:Nrap protein [Cylindrobasidium torrendii FP15055 ss-10]